MSAMRVQLETLNQQLTAVAAKLQVRDAQAKKYKEAVKVLKVGGFVSSQTRKEGFGRVNKACSPGMESSM